MTSDQLAPADVVTLADHVAAEDGAPPLSDQTLTRLSSDEVIHLQARDHGKLVGYGQLDGTQLEIAAEQRAVAPLLTAALGRVGADLLVWSHGRRSRLLPVLGHEKFERVRELHQLRRSLDPESLPAEPPMPDGVSVRAFVPGHDDEAWLALNAVAFASHPEQGRLVQSDLDARIAAPWFDADGFLLAERAGELLGYHWTKVHPDGAGEVYVLGVSPRAQGLGLGGALLVRGLRHLAERGCRQVLLYVEGDNATARRLYERAGFQPYDVDIQWRAPQEAVAAV